MTLWEMLYSIHANSWVYCRAFIKPVLLLFKGRFKKEDRCLKISLVHEKIACWMYCGLGYEVSFSLVSWSFALGGFLE